MLVLFSCKKCYFGLWFGTYETKTSINVSAPRPQHTAEYARACPEHVMHMPT